LIICTRSPPKTSSGAISNSMAIRTSTEFFVMVKIWLSSQVMRASCWAS
jgi:hypothetical protein